MITDELRAKYINALRSGDPSSLSNDELAQIVEAKRAAQQVPLTDPGSDSDAFIDSFKNSMLLNTKPFVAGLGAGAGTLSGGGNFSDAKQAFKEARGDENKKQALFQHFHPWSSIGGGLAGGAALSPLLPSGIALADGASKAVKVANAINTGAKIGTLGGIGSALSNADSPQSAAAHVGAGFLTGGIVSGALEGVISGAQGLSSSDKAKVVKQYLSDKYNKVLSKFSGLPEKDIVTYRGNTSGINKINEESGGDITIPVDNFRTNVKDSIKETKGALSSQIRGAFDSKKGQPERFSITPIIDELEKVKGQFDADLEPEQVNHIQEMIDRIKSKVKGNENDEVSFADIFNIQKFLQKRSGKGFIKDGKFFPLDLGASRAAKNGYLYAKSIVDKASEEIKDANGIYSRLHDLEDVINPNLLKDDKTPNSILVGGSGENPTNARHLRELGNLTGYPVEQEAAKLSAADKFNRPEIVPFGTTGKTLTRYVTGRAVGAGLGGIAGAIGGGEGGRLKGAGIGAGIGGFISSPLAIKGLINAENSLSNSGGLSQFSNLFTSGLEQEVTRQNLFEMLERKRENQSANSYVPIEDAKNIYLNKVNR
jgi:hypothetical protein